MDITRVATVDVATFPRCGQFDPSRTSVSRDRWVLRALSGVAQLGGEFYDLDLADPPPAHLTLSDVEDAYGEWMAVFERGGEGETREYLLFTDASGFYPSFYEVLSDRGGTDVVVGGSLSAVAAESRGRGVKHTIDWDLALAHLLSTHPYLNNVMAGQSFAKTISLLPHTSALHITSASTSLVERPRLNTSSSLSYSQLVDRGIERSLAVMDAAIETGESRVRLNLSGGVDSRVVLSLAVAAGKADRLQAVTSDPSGAKTERAHLVLADDLAVAAALVERYGLAWLRPGSEQLRGRLGFDDRLLLHSSYRSGWNFQVSLGGLAVTNLDTTVTFRGGGGEVLRADKGVITLAEYARDRMGSSVIDMRVARGLAQRTVGWSAELKALGAPLPVALVQTFKDEMGREVLAGASSVYERFRNRSHFGHHREGLRQANDLMVNPLAVPEFGMAAAMLPTEERLAGAVPYDIISRAAPELNSLPFAGYEWSATTVARGGSGGRADITPDVWEEMSSRGVRSWRVARDRREKGGSFEADQEGWWGVRAAGHSYRPGSWGDAAQTRIEELLAALADAEDAVSPEVAATILDATCRRRGDLGKMLGKVLSVGDIAGLTEAPPRDVRTFNVRPPRSLPHRAA